MTPARKDFIDRFRTLARTLDTGPEVDIAIKAKQFAVLLKAAAQAAELSDYVGSEMGADDDEHLQVRLKPMNDLLRQANGLVGVAKKAS